MTDNETKLLKALLVLGIGIPMSIATVIWSGYVLSVIWRWFMVPLFGLPVLSIPAAIGIDALVTLVIPSQKPSKDTEQSTWSAIITGILKPLVMLGVAFIAKLFL